jgi:hypothetical protein
MINISLIKEILGKENCLIVVLENKNTILAEDSQIINQALRDLINKGE